MYMLRCSVYGRIKPDTAGVNLFKHWTNTTLHHDYIYQKDSLQLPVEGGKRRFQKHSREYEWLRSDLTLNTRGWYILIFPLVVVMLTPPGHNQYRVIYY